jgi:hypothetical protein
MTEEVIWTTEEDIIAEQHHIYRWREEEAKLWTYLRRYAANRRRNEESLRRYQYEFETLRTRGWANLTAPERERYLRLRDTLIPQSMARVTSWSSEVDRTVREINSLREKIRIEEDRLRRKKPRPAPEEQFIGDEACSGNDIFYRITDKPLPEDGKNHEKDYIVRDPQTRQLIRIEKKICIELTASIETHEDHDVPLIVEITCTTYVKQKDRSELIRTENLIEKALKEWLIEQNWGNLIHSFTKEGVEYNGQDHVETRGWYTWQVPDYPKVYVFVEKTDPRERSYTGEFKVEE